jgi:diadenosine tetraphosphate (Ap4A) HIT family hydrolase
MQEEWDERVTGLNCPFDNLNEEENEFIYFVKKFSASSLYLDKNQAYQGHCVLIFDPRHVTRIDQLSADEWQQLSQDLYSAEKAIFNAFKPTHMNLASLGNIVPHLHWHIIPRYKNDARWGAPIWTSSQDKMTERYLTDNEYHKLANAITGNL